jgi:hypothetical protein
MHDIGAARAVKFFQDVGEGLAHLPTLPVLSLTTSRRGNQVGARTAWFARLGGCPRSPCRRRRDLEGKRRLGALCVKRNELALRFFGGANPQPHPEWFVRQNLGTRSRLQADPDLVPTGRDFVPFEVHALEPMNGAGTIHGRAVSGPNQTNTRFLPKLGELTVWSEHVEIDICISFCPRNRHMNRPLADFTPLIDQPIVVVVCSIETSLPAQGQTRGKVSSFCGAGVPANSPGGGLPPRDARLV